MGAPCMALITTNDALAEATESVELAEMEAAEAPSASPSVASLVQSLPKSAFPVLVAGKSWGLRAARLCDKRKDPYVRKAYGCAKFGACKGIVIEKLPLGIAAKQPNSACRKAVRVILKNGRKIDAFVPGDGGINYIDENDEVFMTGRGRGKLSVGDIP